MENKNSVTEVETASTQVEKAAAAAVAQRQDGGGGGDIVLVNEGNKIRNIPIPTDDPNDPLNWPKWRKIGIVGTCCWFAIFSLLSVSGIGTFMNTLYKMYGATRTSEEITGLSTYPTMIMALGSFGLLPLAFVFGRRPVFLFAVAIAFITVLTAGSSDDFDGHFISRIFLALATGATESLLPLIISDATFLHERSFYFGFYWSIQNGVNAALQIALSYLTSSSSAGGGWRWYYWLFAVALGASILSSIFLLPETRFPRPAALVDGRVVYTDEFGATHFFSFRSGDEEEARRRFGGGGGEGGGDVEGPTEMSGRTKKKRTFVQELKPWSPMAENGWRIWAGAYWKILKSLSSPGVWFAMLASSISLGIGVAISLVYSTILEERYGWSPESVGLFNVGIIPAAIFAMLYSGYGADKMNVWLAARNGGVHRPEHHLLHLIIPYITGATGIIVFGVCANDPERYSAWGLVVAWAIFEFSFTAVLITTTTFASEVFPENPGAAMVPVVGGKNIISFGASYGLIPMLQIYTYLKAFMILFGIFTAIFALGIPVYFLNSSVSTFITIGTTRM
ncbi:major facilitator superfamily domain-containing protein [Xylariomycetidae sp. FL2044]|nr:major facilitator superfamily domain-containing protein [Xylariomycetidae sp. FL2044]